QPVCQRGDADRSGKPSRTRQAIGAGARLGLQRTGEAPRRRWLRGGAARYNRRVAQKDRRPILRVFAVLFGVLAVSNLLKPFRLGADQTGFVFFGPRLAGTANAIAGPAFGIYLLVYAIGIWRDRPYALPMARAYALYVVVNLVLFQLYAPKPAGAGFVVFGI